MPLRLKTLLLATIFLSQSVIWTVHAQEYPKQQVLDINLHYKDNQVTLTSIDKRLGFLPDYLNQPESGYSLQLLDTEQKELFKVKFNFPTEVITEDFSNPQQVTGSVQTLSEVDQTITVPALENATTLVVLDPSGQKLLEHNLSVIVDPNLAERGASQPTAETKTPNKLVIIAGAIGLGIIATAILTFWYLRRKKSQLPNNPPNNL